MLKSILVNNLEITTDQIRNMDPIVEKAGVPPAILYHAANDRKFDGNFHVTDLIGSGPRQKYLEITKDYSIDIKSAIAAMYGTAMHSLAEEFSHKDHVGEISMNFHGIKMRCDSLYLFESSGKVYLTDYKILGSYGVAKFLGLEKGEGQAVLDDYGNPKIYKSGKNAGKPVTTVEWIKRPNPEERFQYSFQLNAYRVAMDDLLNDSIQMENFPYLKKFQGRKVTDLRLFIIPRDGNLREASNRGITEPYYYEDVELMMDDMVISELAKKAAYLGAHLQDGDMPRICNPTEAWNGRKCEAYCPVAAHCKAYGDNPYTKGVEEDE